VLDLAFLMQIAAPFVYKSQRALLREQHQPDSENIIDSYEIHFVRHCYHFCRSDGWRGHRIRRPGRASDPRKRAQS
jgi:hypothetical protein